MMKSAGRNGFGLKEIRPKAPRGSRMGQSAPISFSLRPARGVRRNKNQKIKKSRGVGLKEVGPKDQRDSFTGQCAPISICRCSQQVEMGLVLRK